MVNPTDAPSPKPITDPIQHPNPQPQFHSLSSLLSTLHNWIGMQIPAYQKTECYNACGLECWHQEIGVAQV